MSYVRELVRTLMQQEAAETGSPEVKEFPANFVYPNSEEQPIHIQHRNTMIRSLERLHVRRNNIIEQLRALELDLASTDVSIKAHVSAIDIFAEASVKLKDEHLSVVADNLPAAKHTQINTGA